MKNNVLILLAIFAITTTQPSYGVVTYLGAEAGVTNQIFTGNPGAFDVDLSGGQFTSNSYNLSGRGQGGLIFDEYNSIEVGYNYYSNTSFNLPDGSTINGNNNLVDLSYILTIPTWINGFGVYARLGIGYNWSNLSDFDNSNTGGVMANSFTDVLGAGVKFRISSNWAWRLEWISDGLISPIPLQSSQALGTMSIQTGYTGFNFYF